MIPPETFNTVAQMSHLFFGAFVTLIWRNPWFVIGLLILTTLKEFWYDFKYEIAAVRGSSLEDLLFYWAGIGLGIVIAYSLKRAKWDNWFKDHNHYGTNTKCSNPDVFISIYGQDREINTND